MTQDDIKQMYDDLAMFNWAICSLADDDNKKSRLALEDKTAGASDLIMCFLQDAHDAINRCGAAINKIGILFRELTSSASASSSSGVSSASTANAGIEKALTLIDEIVIRFAKNAAHAHDRSQST